MEIDFSRLIGLQAILPLISFFKELSLLKVGFFSQHPKYSFKVNYIIFTPGGQKVIKHQGIIYKKSASNCQMLPFVIFDKKRALFAKSSVVLRDFFVKLRKKYPLFEDSGCCFKILDYTLNIVSKFAKITIFLQTLASAYAQ